MRYSQGDWLRYRHHEGWIAEGKVLEVRSDGKYVVGEHDNDSNPNTIKHSEIIDRIME